MEFHAEIQRKLKQFDLAVDLGGHGERIGVLGASGSGKSMTLKSIAGIEKPDRGRIEVDGRVLFDSAKKIDLKPQKRRIGYLFQNYALFPTMTVAQNIAAGLTGTKQEKEALVREMSLRFHLTGLESAYPGALSGGQQQRVALARLMAYRPEMILLDEPFSAMDTFLKDQLQEQLAELLSDYDGCVVLVTHNRDEVYRFCEKLYVLDQGKVIRSGSTGDVFADPRKIAAAKLTGCKNYSELVRLDAHHARLTDWGCMLETVREIPEGTTCLGYRAHDFMPVYGGAPNSFPIKVCSGIELLFETKLYVLPVAGVRRENFTAQEDAGEGAIPERISWFLQREIQREIADRGMPNALGLREDKLLFLR